MRGVLFRKLHVGMPDCANLVLARGVLFSRSFKHFPQNFQPPQADCQMQSSFVFEIHIHQGARYSRLACNLVHGGCVKAFFRENQFGRIENFFPAAFLFFFATFGDIVHGLDHSLVVDRMSMNLRAMYLKS